MKKKKVLLVGPILENLTNFRKELIDKLINERVNIILVCSLKGYTNKDIPAGVEFVDLTVDRRGTNPFKDLGQIIKYCRIIKTLKPDIALLYTTKCSIYAGVACRLTKTPYIINNSGLIDMSTLSKPVEHLLRILYRIGYGGTSCMMYQNHYERDYFNKFLGNCRHVDIPGSGINLERFALKPFPSAEKGYIFNYVARIAKFKGIEEYLDCAKIIHQRYPNTIFRIYGSYDECKYKEKIEEYESLGFVKYMGKKSDMLPEIESCHAVIHPSHYEGLTNVILEHSAMGRVCIASDIPGCREAVDDGVTGFLFPLCDVGALVKKVEIFINMNHKEKESMILSAREKIEKEFDRNIVVSKYMNEINRILNL